MAGLAFETRAIHAGAALNETAALTPPIFQSSTFKLRSAAEGAGFVKESAPAEFYTRWGNPTTKQFEAVMASLEGSEAALAFSSGMGALSALFLSALSQGDHIVVGRSIYSAVAEMGNVFFPRFGISCTFADAGRVEDVERALRETTKLIHVESPTNPTLELCDLSAIGALGKEHGVLTSIDSTFATPVNQRPIEHGFDIVVHAATKALGGHSDVTAGVICARKSLIERAWYHLKILGASLSPFESWLLLRGLKTLAVRVREQNRSALEIARFLEKRSEVERVHYPGLESHPQHAIARRQMSGFGGIVSFELKGGLRRGIRFVESLSVIQLAVSLGGVESIIQHPASMTHGTLPDEEIRKAGISPGLLRLSVGLESTRDLEADIAKALESSAREA
ncbi:MAG TPA: aminotransferase class I/II-fold pyridoxal phosphate-dependent enzyme [Planctomycetota bacterium]|nr:aminotransferase class I/II-fold pyridoxal phosphate-dependent enzyme [Planctomycetota bacterium]